MTMEEKTTWLTPAAYEKLKAELEHLTTEGRRAIEQRIAEARDHGDLRENAEYDTAKNDQGMMEARIRQLQHLLDTAEVREVEHSDTVQIGSVVRILDEDDDELEVFVAPSENKLPGMMLASPDSPLGAALLGAKEGEQVSYEAPAGTFRVTILEVKPYEG